MTFESPGRTNYPAESTVIDASQILATLSNAMIADIYDSIVTKPDGSNGTIPQALLVTDTLLISIAGVTPALFQKTTATVLIIDAEDPTPTGFVGFL